MTHVVAVVADTICYGSLYPKASVCFSCRHSAVSVCNMRSIQLIKDFYQQHHLLWNDLYYLLTVCFLLHTEWRTRALSWCRLPLCWKPIHTRFLLGITSLMVPGASCPGPLTFSWPLMRLRYLFRHSVFSLKNLLVSKYLRTHLMPKSVYQCFQTRIDVAILSVDSPDVRKVHL